MKRFCNSISLFATYARGGFSVAYCKLASAASKITKAVQNNECWRCHLFRRKIRKLIFVTRRTIHVNRGRSWRFVRWLLAFVTWATLWNTMRKERTEHPLGLIKKRAEAGILAAGLYGLNRQHIWVEIKMNLHSKHKLTEWPLYQQPTPEIFYRTLLDRTKRHAPICKTPRQASTARYCRVSQRNLCPISVFAEKLPMVPKTNSARLDLLIFIYSILLSSQLRDNMNLKGNIQSESNCHCHCDNKIRRSYPTRCHTFPPTERHVARRQIAHCCSSKLSSVKLKYPLERFPRTSPRNTKEYGYLRRVKFFQCYSLKRANVNNTSWIIRTGTPLADMVAQYTRKEKNADSDPRKISAPGPQQQSQRAGQSPVFGETGTAIISDSWYVWPMWLIGQSVTWLFSTSKLPSKSFFVFTFLNADLVHQNSWAFCWKMKVSLANYWVVSADTSTDV